MAANMYEGSYSTDFDKEVETQYAVLWFTRNRGLWKGPYPRWKAEKILERMQKWHPKRNSILVTRTSTTTRWTAAARRPE